MDFLLCESTESRSLASFLSFLILYLEKVTGERGPYKNSSLDFSLQFGSVYGRVLPGFLNSFLPFSPSSFFLMRRRNGNGTLFPWKIRTWSAFCISQLTFTRRGPALPPTRRYFILSLSGRKGKNPLYNIIETPLLWTSLRSILHNVPDKWEKYWVHLEQIRRERDWISWAHFNLYLNSHILEAGRAESIGERFGSFPL